MFNIATLAGCIPVVGSIFASLLMHQSIDWGRVAVDAVVTGISIAVTFGIGEAVAGITNFYTKAAVSALAHGAFQGGLSAAQGGKFWAGFAAGVLSSIASSVWKGGSSKSSHWDTSDLSNVHLVTETTIHQGIGAGTGAIGTLVFSAIAGGAGSSIGGGNFWQGATTGLIVAGFNHMMEHGGGDPPSKKRNPLVRADGTRITNADVNGDGKIALIELEYWYRNGGGKTPLPHESFRVVVCC